MIAEHNSSTPCDVLNANGDRFGEVLSRFATLSRHDVYEVLEEQAASYKRFGQIALQLGLCEPVHIWQAWSTQLIHRTPRVNLKQFGVDAQAAADLPAWLAQALGVVPIRTMENRLVIAASDNTLARATEVLTASFSKPVSFVLADKSEIEAAITRYYVQLPARSSLTTVVAGCRKPCGQKCGGEDCPARRKLDAQAISLT